MPTALNAGPPSARQPSSSTSSKARPPRRRPHANTRSPSPRSSCGAERSETASRRLPEGRAQRGNEDFITQGTEALRSHPRDLAQQFEAREKTLLAKVGELTLHVDVLKKAYRYLDKDLPEGICQH